MRINQLTTEQYLERLMKKWPQKIRNEIANAIGNGITGHGTVLSKPAYRRWQYFLKQSSKCNDN